MTALVSPAGYRRLEAGPVVSTVHRLQRRVAARFPERSQVLGQLHRLRSLAHIVDMHQLTKDPERLRPNFDPTRESVDPHLTRADMEHYLDYCSEMLSLIGKVAALCAEGSQDSLVLDTVSRIEALTSGMSGQIWQKISLLPDA